MSLDEVQEVARLAAQRRFVVHGSGPSVDRVAEALGLPPNQVETLLNEIRDRRDGFLPPDRSHLAKPAAIGFGLAAVACALAFLVNLFMGMSGGKTEARTTPASGAAPSFPDYGVSRTPRVAQSNETVPTPTANFTPGERYDSGLSTGTLEPSRVATKDTMGDLRNGLHKAREAQQIASAPESMRAD